MDDQKLGRLIRAVRHRRGWRQVDVAVRSGVSASTISRLEAGRIGRLRIDTLRDVAAAFSLSYEGMLRGLGADEDRLLDQRHAELLGACAKWLERLGWFVVVERSYSEWGERGSIDILAWHAPTRSVLVIEIKSELVSIEATLRKLDEKVRLAPKIARSLGWDPATISRLLVLPDDRTQRRRVQAHAAILERALPVRSRAARAWCRTPAAPMAGLLFLPTMHPLHRKAANGRRERIRTPPNPPAESGVGVSSARSRSEPGLDRP